MASSVTAAARFALGVNIADIPSAFSKASAVVARPDTFSNFVTRSEFHFVSRTLLHQNKPMAMPA